MAGQGRLLARPASTPPPDAKTPDGLRPLGIGSGRDGLSSPRSQTEEILVSPLQRHRLAGPAQISMMPRFKAMVTAWVRSFAPSFAMMRFM